LQPCPVIGFIALFFIGAEEFLLPNESLPLRQDAGSENWISFQGDQSGRTFAHWALFFFGHFFQNFRHSTNSWATFSKVKFMSLTLRKMGWVTFWAIFSHTHFGHPVSLPLFWFSWQQPKSAKTWIAKEIKAKMCLYKGADFMNQFNLPRQNCVGVKYKFVNVDVYKRFVSK
jgi:hypothetical protein